MILLRSRCSRQIHDDVLNVMLMQLTKTVIWWPQLSCLSASLSALVRARDSFKSVLVLHGHLQLPGLYDRTAPDEWWWWALWRGRDRVKWSGSIMDVTGTVLLACFVTQKKRRKIKRLTITEVSNPYEIVLTLSLKLGIITIMWWKQIERWTNSALASCTAGGCSLVQCLFHVTMIYCQCKQAQSAQQHSQPTSKISEQSVIFSYSTLLYNFLQARRNSQFQLSDTKRRATVTGVQWSSWASPTLATGRFPPVSRRQASEVLKQETGSCTAVSPWPPIRSLHGAS